VERVINDPNYGLTADLNKLQQMIKEKLEKVVEKDEIKKIRNNQEWYQLTQEKKRPKNYNTIYVPFPRMLYFMDVIIYNRYEINNYKYILNVIDTNSRYVESRALTNQILTHNAKAKTKKNFTLLDTIIDIMETMGYPQELKCDNQFISKEFIELMAAHNVKVIYSDPNDIIKNSLVERFNRTVANLLQNIRISNASNSNSPLFHWYKYLSVVIKKYNNTIHSRIKQKPKDIWEGRALNEQKIKRVESQFKVDDLVRIKTIKKVFDKGDALKTSKQIYKIEQQVNKRYKLKNLKTNEILKKLYLQTELVINSSVTQVEKTLTPEGVEQPIQINSPAKKFIGATPVKSRKQKVTFPDATDEKKFIGATPVKSRKLKKQ
jgi:hypothetical protein